MAGTYRVVVDERDPTTPFTITGENITPPAASSVGTANVYLLEVPKEDSPTSITLKSGNTTFTEVTGSPAITEFKPIYRSTNRERWMGMVQLHSTHVGKSGIFAVNYSGTGAPIVSGNVTDLQNQKMDSDAAYHQPMRSGSAATIRHFLNLVPGQNIGVSYEDQPSKNQTDVILSTTISAASIPPGNAAYLTGAFHSELTAERLLTAGSGITMVDGGANGNWTVSLNAINQRVQGLQSNTLKGTRPALNMVAGDVATQISVNDDATTGRVNVLLSTVGTVAPTNAQYVTISLSGSLSAERTLVANNIIGLVDGGANRNVTISLLSNSPFQWMSRQEHEVADLFSSSATTVSTFIHRTRKAGFTSDSGGTLSTSLVAYWNLDETSGTRADSKGNNNLTDNNTVTSAAGQIGNAAEFTAANSEKLTIADNADVSTGDIDFTFAGWIYPYSSNANLGVISKADGNDLTNEYKIQIFTTNKLGISVWSTGSVETGLQTTATISANQWTFFVCWHDSVNNQLGIQLNNATAETLSYSNGVRDGTRTFSIGGESANGFFNGRIDEVGFWKKVLTAAERADLYNTGSATTYSTTGAQGTGVAGLGVGIAIITEDTVGNLDSIGSTSFIHQKTTSGAEDSEWVISLRSAGSSLIQYSRLSSSGLSLDREMIILGDKNVGGKVRFVSVYSFNPPNPPIGEADCFALNSGGARVFKVRYNDAGTIRERHIQLT